jgi:hypothetical protein
MINVGFVVIGNLFDNVECGIWLVLVGCRRPSDIGYCLECGGVTQKIRQSLHQCLAYVSFDNRTAFKTPQRIPNTARILLQSKLGQAPNWHSPIG